MAENITLSKHSEVIDCTIDLASSKSESNRALIINALSGGEGMVERLANARDTQTMQRLLELDKSTPVDELTSYIEISLPPDSVTTANK